MTSTPRMGSVDVRIDSLCFQAGRPNLGLVFWCLFSVVVCDCVCVWVCVFAVNVCLRCVTVGLDFFLVFQYKANILAGENVSVF